MQVMQLGGINKIQKVNSVDPRDQIIYETQMEEEKIELQILNQGQDSMTTHNLDSLDERNDSDECLSP